MIQGRTLLEGPTPVSKTGAAKAWRFDSSVLLHFLLAGCGPSSYPCDAEVLEIPAPHPPAQVVECIDDGCDPSQWWTSGDTLLVPCDGGQVLVWW